MIVDEQNENATPLYVVAEDAVSSFRKWLILALLTSALICSYIDRITFALLLEPIKKALGVSDAALGILNGVAFGLFFATMGLPLGMLADRWSRKGTIITGIGIWTVATALCGTAGTFIQLLIARIGVGAGEAGLTPASYSLIRDRFPRERLSLALSIYQLGGQVGAGIAFLVAGAIYRFLQATPHPSWPVVGALAPWQQTFIVVALPGIVILALVMLIREPRPVPAVLPADARGRLSWPVTWRFSKVFLAFAGNVVAAYGLTLWVPALLAREHGWSAGQIGQTYGVIVIFAGPLGLLTGGWISDARMRRDGHGSHLAITFWSGVLALPLALSFGFSSGAAQILVVAACLHFILSLPYGVMPAYIQLHAQSSLRSQISALYVFLINVLGLGVGPSVIGILSSQRPTDPTALRAAICMVSVVSLILSSLFLHRISRHERS